MYEGQCASSLASPGKSGVRVFSLSCWRGLPPAADGSAAGFVLGTERAALCPAVPVCAQSTAPSAVPTRPPGGGRGEQPGSLCPDWTSLSVGLWRVFAEGSVFCGEGSVDLRTGA